MSDGSPAFERAADDLERLSHMSRLEARGTLRLALREAGLAPRGVNFRSMLVVFEKVMPTMLGKRGVRGGADVCRAIAGALRGPAGIEGSDADTPEKVFARMASPARSSVAPPPFLSSTSSGTDTGRMSAVPAASGSGTGRMSAVPAASGSGTGRMSAVPAPDRGSAPRR